ncbi:acyl-CoA synthetase [Aeromicrobium alkaliterrae]|uniref:Acyl-CoA synthetase n=1 Tax=Aeromicrobium alkaliterrae TaxID=302168 RepID=A0ABP4VEC9_9ACTN
MYPGTFAATTPDKPAVIMSGSGETLTYGQLDDRSARLARVLHDRGLRRGDVIAMLVDNSPEALVVYWAGLRSGLYVTAINHHLTAAEIAYIVDDSDATALIASATLGVVAESIVPDTPRATHRLAFGGSVPGYESYEEALAGAGDRLAEQPRGTDMLYSSGTTGRPKGIKAPLLPIQVDEPGDPVYGLLGSAFQMSTDTVYLSAAPIYHAAPLRWCGVVQANGGTVVMMERFEPEAALAAIDQHHVTLLQMVPTMFVRMLQLPDDVRARYDISSLRMAVHAAAPCPPDVKQAMIDWWGPKLVEYYSSTEANGLTLISSQEWLTKRGSVGQSKLGVPHICDETGAELPAGEIGTVWFEREQVPFRYHKDDAKTAEATHPDHPLWTAVGDLGYLDDDGYLFLTDRKSFMIISGGVNIYPQEVENVLTLHPAIHDVAVIGVPHAEMGQEVKAVVTLREGHEPSPDLEAAIIAHVRDRIAAFKAPRSVDFVDELPRTPTGKLVKRRLEERYAQEASA